MTAIFLLIPALLLALSAVGMVWIRVAAAEYRHNWSLTQEITAVRTGSDEATITLGGSLSAVGPR